MSDPEVMVPIDDPGIPLELREHGTRFRNPAAWVEDLGDGEYALYAADGELLDLVRLRG